MKIRSAIILIKRKIFDFYRKFYRFKLKNKNFSVIAKDCTGGWILHELGLRFDTPTIKVRLNAPDFVKFCANLKYYISQELTEFNDPTKNHPVGSLGTGEKRIIVYLTHYKTFSQAKAKWDERKKRIHFDNLYFIMTDGDCINDEIIKEFDSLTCGHKAILTYRDLDNIKSAVKLKALPYKDENGIITGIGQPEIVAYKPAPSAKRFIDDWDYVAFLNS